MDEKNAQVKALLVFAVEVPTLTIIFSITLYYFLTTVLRFHNLTPQMVMGISVFIALGFILLLSGEKHLKGKHMKQIVNEAQFWVSGVLLGLVAPLIFQMIVDRRYFVFSIEPMVISILWIFGLSLLIFGGIYGLAKLIIEAAYHRTGRRHL